MKISLVIALVISVILPMAHSCVPCSEIKCPPLNKLNCKGGRVKDVCGCCPACAKVLGEECGGPPWNSAGKCDSGLECKKSPHVFKEIGGGFFAHGKCLPGK
jgi:HtrA serine peptidase 1